MGGVSLSHGASLLIHSLIFSFDSHLLGTHCVVSILGIEDRTVNEADAIFALMELAVYLGVYLGIFLKKTWVFRKTHYGHVKLKFNNYLLVSFYILGIVLGTWNIEMKKKKVLTTHILKE